YLGQLSHDVLLSFAGYRLGLRRNSAAGKQIAEADFALSPRYVQRYGFLAATATPPTSLIHCLIYRDSINPGFQSCLSPNTAEATIDFQKSVLRGIPCFFGISE